MDVMKKRSIKLAVGFLVLLFMGVSLAWSVFVVPIEQYFGWTRSQTSLAFTINVISFAVGSVAAGNLSRYIPFNHMLKIAPVIIASGFFLASNMSAIWQLYLGYGVLVGGGVGFGYNCILSSVPVWFPEKSATATGTLLMGYALSTAVFGPILNGLIGSIGILSAFRVLAIVCGLGVFCFGLLIRVPSFDEMTQLPQRKAGAGKKARNYITSEMVRIPLFWIYYIMTILMPGVGIAMINHNSPILTESLGTSASVAAMIVSMVAICNGVARFCYGFVFDKLGVKISIILVSVINIVSMVGIILGVTSHMTALYILSVCLMLVSFGCNATMMPSMIREMFGHRTFSLNFSVLSTNSVISAFFPTIVGSLQTTTGSYVLPLTLLTGISALNLVFLVLFLKFFSDMEKA